MQHQVQIFAGTFNVNDFGDVAGLQKVNFLSGEHCSVLFHLLEILYGRIAFRKHC
jgi:hypothetical protein